jgi:hypothetical protein
MSADFCCRCGADRATLRVQEHDVWVRVCRRCVASGETVVLELPAGEVVGNVTPEVNR